MNHVATKLNIGCGNDIKKGWINLDSAPISGVDVIHDINSLPLPFKDEMFEEVLCQDVLEHSENYIAILRDIHRILRPGGKLIIRVPHFTSKNAYTDPTHRSYFACRTFYFFTKQGIKGRSYYFDFHFEQVHVSITFERSSKLFFYNALISFLVNRSDRMRYLYESTLLSRVFPAENILVELIK